jgi:hypothetical protein
MPSPVPTGRVPSASRTAASIARAQSTTSAAGAPEASPTAPAHSGISLVRIQPATLGESRSAPTTPRTSAVCHARSSSSRYSDRSCLAASLLAKP